MLINYMNIIKSNTSNKSHLKSNKQVIGDIQQHINIHQNVVVKLLFSNIHEYKSWGNLNLYSLFMP